MFCAGRVPDEDLQRTMKSCGGAIQSTVHDLNDETLATCETFEEKQVRHFWAQWALSRVENENGLKFVIFDAPNESNVQHYIKVVDFSPIVLTLNV